MAYYTVFLEKKTVQLSSSQKLLTASYPASLQYNPGPHSFICMVNLSSYLYLSLPGGILPANFPSRILFLNSPTFAV